MQIKKICLIAFFALTSLSTFASAKQTPQTGVYWQLNSGREVVSIINNNNQTMRLSVTVNASRIIEGDIRVVNNHILLNCAGKSYQRVLAGDTGTCILKPNNIAYLTLLKRTGKGYAWISDGTYQFLDVDHSH